MCMRFIHDCANNICVFAIFYPITKCNSIHCMVDGQLGVFQLEVVTNKAAGIVCFSHVSFSISSEFWNIS